MPFFSNVGVARRVLKLLALSRGGARAIRNWGRISQGSKTVGREGRVGVSIPRGIFAQQVGSHNWPHT